MLTTLSDRRQIALVGDEDIPHHVSELVQVKGAFIGSTEHRAAEGAAAVQRHIRRGRDRRAGAELPDRGQVSAPALPRSGRADLR